MLPLWWWPLAVLFALVIWAILVLAVWLVLAEIFTTLERRRRRRARAAADVLFIDGRRA